MLSKLLSALLAVAVVFAAVPAYAHQTADHARPVATVGVHGQLLATDTPTTVADSGINVAVVRRQVALLQSQVAEASRQVAALSASEVTQADLAALSQRIDKLEQQLNMLAQLLTVGGRGTSAAQVYEKVKASVVYIEIFTKDAEKHGSGVVAYQPAEGGWALVTTNAHVVAGATDIFVVTDEGRVLGGTVWATDADLDYAVVKIQGQRLPPTIPIGNPDAVKIGDPVVVVGNPLGYRNSVSAGVLSGRSYLKDNNGYEFLQTDAAANPGNSGGPMLDQNGNWIGMITERDIRSSSSGLNFAISLNAIRQSIAISNRPDQKRAYCGVVVSQGVLATAGIPSPTGVTVTTLDPGGPLASAGVRLGDEILMAGNKEMHTLADMRTLVDTTVPGTSVAFRIKRNGSNVDVTAALGGVAFYQPKAVLALVRSLAETEGAF